jgi:hypothetical protein
MGFSASLSLSVGAWCCTKLKSTSYACHRIIYIVLYISLSEEEMKTSRMFMGHLSVLPKLELSKSHHSHHLCNNISAVSCS